MMKTLAILIALTASASAGTCRLGWDPQPGCSFKVRRGIDTLATVTSNGATITLPDSGLSIVSVTAFNDSGESAPSSITIVPVVVQRSIDLKIWQTRIVIYDELAGSAFYRLTPPSITP